MPVQRQGEPDNPSQEDVPRGNDISEKSSPKEYVFER